MLRTFCMSDQAIRSLCRWSPSDERRATAAPAPVLEKPFDAPAQMAASAAAVPPFPLHAYATAARGPGHHWSALAGGACVLGGAAMLGWIGFDHLMHRDTATLVDFAGKVPDKRDSQPAKFQPPAAVTARAVDSAAAGTSAAVAASMPALPSAAPRFVAASNPAAATVPIPASTSVPALRFAPAHGFADKAVSHRRKLVREKSGRQHGAIPRAPRGSPQQTKRRTQRQLLMTSHAARSRKSRQTCRRSRRLPEPIHLSLRLGSVSTNTRG
jgi:hypothetical protein